MYSNIEIKGENEELVIIDSARYDRCHAALAEAQRAMEAALDAWERRDLMYIPDGDPAKYIYAVVLQAWESTGKNAPRSINEDDPLCKFVAEALVLAKIRVGQGKTKGARDTPAAISAVLSGQTKRLNFIRISEGG